MSGETDRLIQPEQKAADEQSPRRDHPDTEVVRKVGVEKFEIDDNVVRVSIIGVCMISRSGGGGCLKRSPVKGSIS
jgi:hypothetical protein